MSALWRGDGVPNRNAVFLCLSCAVGIVVVVAVARRMRRYYFSSAEEEEDDWDSKPQKRFRKVLADNSLPFVHLEAPGKGEEFHPFGDEIRALVENPVWSFSDAEASPFDMEEPFIWIETKDALEDLANVLSKQTVFAVDTEQHSLRSFLGFTALIQISTYKHDYLVDAIALHDDMEVLKPVFANASICKVFHGADSDILWLQRDFHIYVVNLFDTARACDVLGKPQRSLAYLLENYCNVSTNKIFQKSDWRQRPLPQDMLLYARTDVHFLLYIAKKVYDELLQGETDVSKSPLQLALRRSHLICLQLYEKDASPLAAATSLLAKFQESSLDKSQATAIRRRLRLLCEWRDYVARIEDESLRFVLSDAAILAIARTFPSNTKELYRVIHAADKLTSTSSSTTNLLPSPSPVVKRHITSLLLAIENSTEVTAGAASVEQGAKAKGNRFTFNKRGNVEFKRMQFVKKFSCKGLVYENCRIYAGDGRLLCYCDRRKLEWYLQRGLAERLNEEPPAIRLRFEPKGRPEDENNEFYIQSKSNQCVGCGDTSHYLRYRIIPSCYRQHFPEYLKSHRSHDIVLLCVDCHEKAHRAAEKYKHVIAAEFGTPLFARKIMAAEGPEYSVIESETGVSPLQLRNAAMALLCHGPDMPEARRVELEMVISGYFGGRQVDEEDMKTAALVGIDPRGKKRLSRRIDKLLRKKQVVPKERTNLANKSLASVARHDDTKKDSAKTPKISLLGHGLHGKKVVEKIWGEHGEDGIRDFVQRWRLVFVEAVNPSYLPTGWEVTHSGHREFGEYSVYRPKWQTRT